MVVALGVLETARKWTMTWFSTLGAYLSACSVGLLLGGRDASVTLWFQLRIGRPWLLRWGIGRWLLVMEPFAFYMISGLLLPIGC